MKKFVLQREPDRRKDASYRIPYTELLNDRQYQAVMHEGGPALVVAGAGTGKTRTLTYRVARLIEDGNPPESILLLTFTRRAAREMLERATGVLDDRCSRVKGGTFHHYCNQLLHRYADRIGFPNHFTLLDQADAADVIRYLRTSVARQLKGKRFPQKHALAAMFSSTVNKQISLYEVLASQYPQFLEHYDMIEELQKRYSEYKSANAVMDFDDLLVYTRFLLIQEKDICRKVASQNRYVMVDEYQDTNNLQDELTSLFSSAHRDLLVVGDDAQSIYSFRGANFRNILSFPERFENCHVIKLEENYRSTAPILNLSNTLINKASEKFEKKLFTVKQEGDLPGLVKASSERDQSRFICQLLLQLREQGRALGDMAVLFRNGRDSYDLEWELGKRNIPFQKFGGQKFAEAAHVRDVLAHLRVIVNPEDQVAWNRVLLLLEGIGPQTASELIQWLRRNKEENLADSNIVSRAYKKQLEKLSMTLSEVTSFRQYPGKAVESVAAYYQPICEKRHDDHPKRIKDLEAFAGLAGGYASLDQLLQELTLDPLDATAVETEAREKDETPLVLSTIHSAKGLEWDTVFVVQCLDGIIPSGYSVDDPMALDEELRLLYVACTRAREQLFITYPVTRESTYGEYFSNPSRFLEGIHERTLEPWLLEEEPARQQLSP
ncbi:MAG: UvrD-helicase domain-containing protein [Cyclonatronaceae bacterium]